MPTRISTTGAEPVTRDEAKVAARVDNDLGATSSLDGLIDTLITTAREDAEDLTGRCYRPQVQLVELRDWPSSSDVLPVYRPTACVIRYWTGSAFATLAAGLYDFAPGGPGDTGTLIAPAAGQAWPVLPARAIGTRVQIELTAGPAAPADVPAGVRTYILASVAGWIDNPAALVDGRAVRNPLFESLLNGQKLFR